ncbi:MAG: Spore coat protein CotH [Aeromicrobium sp.]|jgi:hypothetical protein|nr:Spore coat protein CotH [Aeromicrobium sp.]
MSALRTRLALAAVVTLGFIVPQAVTSASAAPPNGTIVVAPSDPISGETFKVSGAFQGSTRDVWLQHKNSDGDWLTDDQGSTDSTGAYTFNTSTTSDETIRAYEPPTGSDGPNDGVPSDTFDVHVATTSGHLTINGASSSTLNATSNFSPDRAGQTVTLQYSNDMSSWTTSKTGTQDASGQTVFATVTSVPAYTRFWRAITTYSGASSATATNVVSFAPTPSKVDHNLPVVRVNLQGGSAISTRTHYFQMNMSIDSGDPASPAINAPAVDVGLPIYASPNNYVDQIKGRGNYSWSFPKKGFRIKLASKAPLLGMPSSKHWVLMANFYDKSLLRNSTALDLSSKIFTNIPTGWTVKYKNVELVVNGDYRGTYQLMEQVRIASDRVDIDELTQSDDPAVTPCLVANCMTGGYLMEWNFRKDAPSFKTPSGSYITIDDPAPDSTDPEEKPYYDSQAFKDQKKYITDYVSAADKAIYGSNFKDPVNGYAKYINVDSFIDWWLDNEIMKTVDGQLYASAYMYKPRDTASTPGKLTMGPAWDFDLSSGDITRSGDAVSPTGWYLRNSNAATARQVKTTWINRLFQDPAFVHKVEQRWAQVYPTIHASAVVNSIEQARIQIADSAVGNFSTAGWSVTQHFSKYQVVKGTYNKEVDYLQSWISTRINWINSQLG